MQARQPSAIRLKNCVTAGLLQILAFQKLALLQVPLEMTKRELQVQRKSKAPWGPRIHVPIQRVATDMTGLLNRFRLTAQSYLANSTLPAFLC